MDDAESLAFTPEKGLGLGEGDLYSNTESQNWFGQKSVVTAGNKSEIERTTESSNLTN